MIAPVSSSICCHLVSCTSTKGPQRFTGIDENLYASGFIISARCFSDNDNDVSIVSCLEHGACIYGKMYRIESVNSTCFELRARAGPRLLIMLFGDSAAGIAAAAL